MVKGNVVCAVLILYLLIQSLKPKELRSQGQLPPKIQDLCKMHFSFFEAIPQCGRLSYREETGKLWQTPVESLQPNTGDSVVVLVGLNLSVKEQANIITPALSPCISQPREQQSHCHSMDRAHMSRNKTSLGLEVSSPDFTSQAIALASGCQLHSLCWQPVFFC